MTLQLAEVGVVLPSVHGDPVNVPVPLLVNATVPVGVVAAVTVAVQVVGALIGTEDGLQLTDTLVVPPVTVRPNVPELAA